MAKNGVKTGKTGSLGFVAFVAIILVAIAYIFVGLEACFNSWNLNFSFGRIPGLLQWISSILLTCIVVYLSYDFAMRQSKTWRIIWWVLAIIAILAVLGFGGFNVFA